MRRRRSCVPVPSTPSGKEQVQLRGLLDHKPLLRSASPLPTGIRRDEPVRLRARSSDSKASVGILARGGDEVTPTSRHHRREARLHLPPVLLTRNLSHLALMGAEAGKFCLEFVPEWSEARSRRHSLEREIRKSRAQMLWRILRTRNRAQNLLLHHLIQRKAERSNQQ